MPTVSGVWKWNDTLSQLNGITQSVNFHSNNVAYTEIEYSTGLTGPFNMHYDSTTVYDANIWTNEAYKTIDFGSSPQEVSQNFYDFLTANATYQSTVKTVSSDNLARFKQKCDETYAAIDNIPTVSTELVNLGTLSTSGTLTTDQATQIGTTTVGVTARASVNSVTRFYERVNISGTTAMLISADDDALHVLTVNLSTRAYTLSDVAIGGGGGPDIPTPTTSDNGKILGVTNGVYALQEASGGGTISGYTVTVEQGALAGVSSPSIVFEKADGTTQTVTSSASSTIVNNVVKIWAKIGVDGNGLGVSGGINMLTSFIDASNKNIIVYSVYGNGKIPKGGGAD